MTCTHGCDPPSRKRLCASCDRVVARGPHAPTRERCGPYGLGESEGCRRAADRVTTLSGVVTETRKPLVRLWVTRGLLALACVITFLGVVLVIAAWTEDIKIDGDIRYAYAEVVSDDFSRTLVRFYTSDGAEHIPEIGVLYPAGLKVGDVVQVEYRQDDPELVRVAGRGAFVTLLPVGLTLVVTWAVIGPTVWWLRRRM